MITFEENIKVILFQPKSVISARSLEISFRKKNCRFTTIGAFVITYKRSMPVTSVTEIDGWAELISCRLFALFSITNSFLYRSRLFPSSSKRSFSNPLDLLPGGGGRVLPYIGYIGMCRCEGYGFQGVYSRIGYINQSVWL